jgi:D-serine deaminase-like pyridoxal phosphate-dependent protein
MTQIVNLSTPALVVDRQKFDANVAIMTAVRPGLTLRPHIKAHKSTALAHELAKVGHTAFTCATPREIIGMAQAGLGSDLLLANETVDPVRLRTMAALLHNSRITVAIDSDVTARMAAENGIKDVLIDVNVGMPRCGVAPERAAALATLAVSLGLNVRGVMGYEGHLMAVADRDEQRAKVRSAMGAVGEWELPFQQALYVVGTVISVSDGWAVIDVGLKSLGMDHGNPTIEGASVWFCSDEHITFSMKDGRPLPVVGSRVLVRPAHIDPTIALHEAMHVVDQIPVIGVLPSETDKTGTGGTVIDTWPVNLRHW